MVLDVFRKYVPIRLDGNRSCNRVELEHPTSFDIGGLSHVCWGGLTVINN